MHRPGVAHEILPGERESREKLGGEERPFSLIAATARRHEVSGEVAPSSGHWDHMIQGGGLETEPGPAIDTTASTIPKGCALDLALVLLVLEAASVAG